MKIYIAVDMEGLTGVVHSSQTVSTVHQRDYLEARECMIAEANAAVEGATQGGAVEITVNDVHWPMRNLVPDRLDRRANLVRGFNKPRFTLQGLDESIDLSMLIGYHGTASMNDAVLGHTYLSKEIIKIEGSAEDQYDLLELSIEALVAGEMGVPIGLVTGDTATVNRAKSLLGPIETVEVKKGLDRYAAHSLSLEDSCQRITEAAKRAVERVKELHPLHSKSSPGLKVEFANASHVVRTTSITGIETLSPREISIQGITWCEVYSILAMAVQTVAQNIDLYY